MNYRIRVMKDGEVVHTEPAAEHPAESYLDQLVSQYSADYCDVCRI